VTDDISLKIALCFGPSLWIVYGLIRSDWVVAVTNLAGLSLVGVVLVCKIRDLRGG
jgi:hypothetical protein